jgi:xylulokinase
LIRDLGLEREKLPPLHRSIDVIGDLLPEVAAELGLPQGVKVVAGAYDLPAAAVGSGAVEDYQAHLTLATSSFLTVHVPFKKTDLMNGIASLPCAIPNRYLVLAEQEAAGVNLTFMRDNLLFHSDALLDMRTPADFFEALNRVAESAPPGSNGLIYTPWIYGERAPVDDPFIRAGLHNISLHNTRADLARAIFEGVALNTRWVLDPVERFCARRLETIHVVGGGANSDLWCQILADVLNRTICQVRNPIQAAARGAAFIAAVGLGFLQFSEIPKYIHFQNEFHPNPDNGHLYDELFEAFVNLYKSNKDIYRHLNRAKRNAT